MLCRGRLLLSHAGLVSKRLAVPACQKLNQSSLAQPVPEGQEQPVSPKIQSLVTEISKLTLLEVSELSGALKKALNLPDAPVAMMAGPGAFAAAPAAEEEEEAPQKVQTAFTVKLMKFDDSKKVALIKEVKALVEGMNLVQAKKFVESAPTIVKADLPKEEAEKLAAALNAVGATCEIQ
ncbi:large ribosomal subunit protein bL12m [Neocloeon triangulifer]|uniref:large ribosomal subunit protein bL12m n=1 Tax=Neocloeon triangulifer TaxID=2078957 RepID=UPI00286F839B|nr:large ribosomal subunit protein bL12m [Neocloeon triangulifer]